MIDNYFDEVEMLQIKSFLGSAVTIASELKKWGVNHQFWLTA